MLSSRIMYNQGLTIPASPKFTVEFAGPGAHTWLRQSATEKPVPILLIAEKMVTWALVPKVCQRAGV